VSVKFLVVAKGLLQISLEEYLIEKSSKDPSLLYFPGGRWVGWASEQTGK
jgi:hypothetical protein